ncbi:MAG: hypothetical protein U5R31_14815 [Acidimicrobiia bacterium]|nr:hypothetical protein [Acidimicrobiia bacterium]
MTPADIVACFEPYRPEGYTAGRAREALAEHLGDAGFRKDLAPLLREVPAGYDIDGAAAARFANRCSVSCRGAAA